MAPDLSRILEVAAGAVVGLVAVSFFRAFVGAGDDPTLARYISDAMGWADPETSDPPQTRI